MTHMTRSPNSTTPTLWRQERLHNSPISDPTHKHKMPMSAATAQSSQSSGEIKPIRRMSRASKKTPTKYLSTTAKNFKSLVHRHTACPPTPPPFSLIGGSGKFRGPVTISFDQGLGYYHQEQGEPCIANSNQAILNNAGFIDQIITRPSVGFSWSSSSTCGVDELSRHQPPSIAYDDQYNNKADYAVVGSTTASPDCFDPYLGLPTTDAAGLDQENADDGVDWFDFVAEFLTADAIL